MCGDVPKGHSARDVVVAVNGAKSTINLPYQFRNVVEIRLREYYFLGGVPGVYRCKLTNDMITEEQTNLGGDGFVFSLLDQTSNREHYDNPRTVAKYERGSLSMLNVQLQLIDPATLNTNPAGPAFLIGYFLITIITRDEKYDREFIDSLNQNDQVQRNQLPFNQRMPFMQTK